jgi:hypothetical protein
MLPLPMPHQSCRGGPGMQSMHSVVTFSFWFGLQPKNSNSSTTSAV